MVRPVDQEMTAIEKTVCHSQSPRGGLTPRLALGREGLQGSIRICQKAESAKGKHGQEISLWFPEEKQVWQGYRFRIG